MTLKEALEWWHWGDGLDVTARYGVEDYEAYFAPVLAAARAVDEGTPIWWCLVHGAQAWDARNLFCLIAPGDSDERGCRMVSRRLIEWEEE